MAMDKPDQPIGQPFVIPPNREEVTGEPQALEGHHDKRYPDVSWVHSPRLYGGGHVPEDYEWTSNPKQHQDELMGEWPEEH